jgi:hypothetical protein
MNFIDLTNFFLAVVPHNDLGGISECQIRWAPMGNIHITSIIRVMQLIPSKSEKLIAQGIYPMLAWFSLM